VFGQQVDFTKSRIPHVPQQAKKKSKGGDSYTGEQVEKVITHLKRERN